MLRWIVRNALCTYYKQHRVKANELLLLWEGVALSFRILLGAMKIFVDSMRCSANTFCKPSSKYQFRLTIGKHKANLFIIGKQEASETAWENIIFVVTNTDIEVVFSFYLKQCKVSAYNLFRKSYFRQKVRYFSVNSTTLVFGNKHSGCIWSWGSWHWLVLSVKNFFTDDLNIFTDD